VNGVLPAIERLCSQSGDFRLTLDNALAKRRAIHSAGDNAREVSQLRFEFRFPTTHFFEITRHPAQLLRKFKLDLLEDMRN
jgi:hypothetical protein